MGKLMKLCLNEKSFVFTDEIGSVSIFVSRVVFKGAANHGCPSCIGG